MRTLFNAVLVATLSVALVGAPTLASAASAPSAPIGVILQAGNAKVGLDVSYGGSTIYDGDRLQTSENQSLRVRLGGPEMYLRPSTAALVHALPNGFSADLASGTVVVSAAAGQTFQVLADGAAIRPSGSQTTVGQITRVSANELLLSSTRGALEVSMGGEVKTVEAGSSYKMEVETDASSDAGPQPQGPYHTARNRFLWILIPAIAAGTAIGIWRALVSPAAPSGLSASVN